MTRLIDVFSGAGGLSEGFRGAGFDVRLGIDLAPHACATHEENFQEAATWCRDITGVTGRAIRDAVGGAVEVVIGGPNCQGVSERGGRDPLDPRNLMFWEFIRIVSELKPRAFLMENVAGLTHRHNWKLLQAVVRALVNLGYRCGGDVIRATDHGVPQLRHRFVLLGVRGGDGPVLFPRPTHGDANDREKCPRLLPHVTLKMAIGDLPEISSGGGAEISEYDKVAFSAYQREARRGSTVIYNHRASAVASINLNRISFVREGGNWKDIPVSLLPPRFFQCRLTDHSTTYARPRWDHPSFTLTALFGNVTAGAYTHPSQNRAFSVREGARIHSFPDCFRFKGPLNSQYRQIGNAVPPLLAQAFAEHLSEYLGCGRFAEGSVSPRLPDEFILNAQWEDIPVLTPRYRDLFGTGTRWPVGWGAEPLDRRAVLTDNYRLRSIPALAAVA